MNHRITAVLCVLCIVLGLIAGALAGRASGSRVRYQIGTFGEYPYHRLYRADTFTGQTWTVKPMAKDARWGEILDALGND